MVDQMPRLEASATQVSGPGFGSQNPSEKPILAQPMAPMLGSETVLSWELVASSRKMVISLGSMGDLVLEVKQRIN